MEKSEIISKIKSQIYHYEQPLSLRGGGIAADKAIPLSQLDCRVAQGAPGNDGLANDKFINLSQ